MPFVGLQSGPVTLYAQLASILRDRIMSGAWKYEEEIPTLDDLAKQFSVARVTVRQAIQMLASEGLLSSQRGRRTFVTFAPPLLDQGRLFSSTGSMDIDSQNYRIDILSKEKVATLPPRNLAAGHPSGDYMRIRKVDSENGSPYTVSDNYVSAAIYKRFPKGSEKSTKISRLVCDYAQRPIERAYEIIRVDSVGYDEVMHLQVPIGSPVARVYRVFLGPDDEIAYFGALNYRGDRFTIERDISQYVQRR